jgi:hypothetical protein
MRRDCACKFASSLRVVWRRRWKWMLMLLLCCCVDCDDDTTKTRNGDEVGRRAELARRVAQSGWQARIAETVYTAS